MDLSDLGIGDADIAAAVEPFVVERRPRDEPGFEKRAAALGRR